MSDNFACPECGVKLRRLEGLSPGVKVKCPRCGCEFAAPPEDTVLAGPDPGRAGAESQVTGSPPAPPAAREDDHPDHGADEGERVQREPRAPGRWRPSGEFAADDYGMEGRGLGSLPDDYTINLGEWFRYAQAHWGEVVGPMIGYLLVSQAIQLAVSCIPYLGGIVQAILQPPLQAGFVIVALAQLQGRRWTFNDFFGGFQRWGTLLGNSILVGLILVAAAIPAVIAVVVAANADDDGTRAVAIGCAVLASLPVIYLSVRVSTFCVPLIIDRDCNATEAIQGSWALTRGHFWGLFGIALLLGLINLGGLLALLVGFLFTFPLTVLVSAAGYLLIAGSRPPVERKSSWDGDREMG
jgi:hypothetical protein